MHYQQINISIHVISDSYNLSSRHLPNKLLPHLNYAHFHSSSSSFNGIAKYLSSLNYYRYALIDRYIFAEQRLLPFREPIDAFSRTYAPRYKIFLGLITRTRGIPLIAITDLLFSSARISILRSFLAVRFSLAPIDDSDCRSSAYKYRKCGFDYES